MSYAVEIPKSTKKEIAAIRALAVDPRPDGCAKMAGFRDTYRIRVGDYRVVYEVHDRVLLVLLLWVAHRREAYR